jgi:hypothetical protein
MGSANSADDRSKTLTFVSFALPRQSSPGLNEALRLSIGEGGGMPTAVRHTYALGKPLISRAEIFVV